VWHLLIFESGAAKASRLDPCSYVFSDGSLGAGSSRKNSNGTRGRSEDDELCIAVDYFPLVIHALSQCFLDAALFGTKGT
jgi:hypothetical protein